MSDLHRRHREAQHRLRDAIGAAVAGALATITLQRSPGIRAGYVAETARVVSGGQLDSAQLALAYVGEQVPFTEPPNLDAAFGDRLMTPDHPGAVYGLAYLWCLLDQGMPEADARERAGSATATLAQGDLQAAQRIGLNEGARAAGRKPRWRKEASASACDWCREVASEGAVFDAADSVPFHGGTDTCSVSAEFD